mmetsp:Transcript_907/g.1170  ORF Transcript_907/g.1170 Transcript_907/m.1170 type:complete len:379 (-) Transcript_907:277-1413(-)|eukprot:CAMPEP_0172515136 /NCGR_PEP_ID=MMETSP1066-20121228/265596_1 /TAXON_ID=671091 /ORGANISM="Coscinodiscus wailesii, Strain CCMP2513" /LENGTH=378 /DNA_ID=CAMNT_0013296099 /DNA_START=77 /DNA_END=1213 /DNA_ORIENTATION=+
MKKKHEYKQFGLQNRIPVKMIAGVLILILHVHVSSAAFTKTLATTPHTSFIGTTRPINPLIPSFFNDRKNQKQVINAIPYRSSSDEDYYLDITTPPLFSLDPVTSEAQHITSQLGITPDQHELLVQLSSLVVSWNKKINLVSRKDCTESVVFGRHILPSIALHSSLLSSSQVSFGNGKNIVDVGTGGGFPGLPLAVLYPESKFLLVDAVKKKLTVVEDMARELGLENVSVYHGRVEEMAKQEHWGKYDVCLGRSVTSLPKFCFWVQHLLKEQGGRLVYIIGGEVEDIVEERVTMSVPLNELLRDESISDKRALILEAVNVTAVAKESGEKPVKRGTPRKKPKNIIRKGNQRAKGEWAKKDNSVPKQRGYENFKRYDAS